MPRGRCHFALLIKLQERLEQQLPEVGALTALHLPEFLAGSLAPDAMRSLGKMGKFNSHFYSEDRRDTWGKSISGLFETHDHLSAYHNLPEADRALLMGYIAHLTTDEAFRDEVTIHVHGIEDWRPIIHGLWSFVDEFEIAHPDLSGVVDAFESDGQVGFIDREITRTFLARARGWTTSDDPVVHEQVFLRMFGHDLTVEEVEERLAHNRGQAERFLSQDVKAQFIDEAITRGVDEIKKFVTGVYSESAGQ